MAPMGERHDHCDHDPIECSYDALVGEYQEAVAERDRLRAVVERAHDHVATDEHVLRSLAIDDLVALVGVLRRDYAFATNAADAAAEAVGNMAEKCSTLMAERDRLRAVVDAVRVLVEQPGEWYDADMATEPYNRLMAALTQLDYSDGDRTKVQLDGSADMGDHGSVTPEEDDPDDLAHVVDQVLDALEEVVRQQWVHAGGGRYWQPSTTTYGVIANALVTYRPGRWARVPGGLQWSPEAST